MILKLWNTISRWKKYELFSKRIDPGSRIQWIFFKRSKGSHQIYFNSITNKTVVVPVHGNRDMPKGTYLAILKQAGVE
ncbi:MAG: type II toxin-antitoxin system HicA family toxin [Bacteroidota bacterium]|nr:type II toxin-antitoxin system HicA family toxin [Bacteroidota bacterium]